MTSLPPPTPGRRVRVGRAAVPLLDATTATGLLVVLALAALPGRHRVADPLYALVVVGALAALVARTARRGPGRAPWLLLTAGAAVTALAHAGLVVPGAVPDGASGALSLVRQHPWLAVAGLLGHPLMMVGQLLLVAQRVRDTVRTGWLDTLLGIGTLAVVAFAFVLPPLQRHLDLGTAGAAVLVGRPALDVMLLALALGGCAFTGARTDWRMPLLAAAAGLLLVADATDVLTIAGVLERSGWATPVVGLGRLGALLLLVAASRRTAPPPADQRPESTWSNLLSPAGTLVVVVVVLTVDHHQRVGPGAVYLALAALVGVGTKIALVFRAVVTLADTRRLAVTDDLTGLANRRGLHASLAAALAPPPGTASRTLSGSTGGGALPTALVLVGLDGFKRVNDTYGRAAGDALLRTTAERLERVAPARSTVARLGGDEFALTLPATGPEAALAVARAVHAALGAPVEVGGRHLRVRASAGVSSSDDATPSGSCPGRTAEPGTPDPGTQVPGTQLSGAQLSGPPDAEARGEQLLRRADAAMHHAKETGGGVAVHDPALATAADAEALLVEDLRRVLASPLLSAEQVLVHYQPQVDARTLRVVGVEALVRWQHPVLGLVAPDAFLPLVEREGLMGPLTTVVLHTAAEQAQVWRRAGHPLRLAVNLSTSCLAAPGLLALVDEVLLATGGDPRDLVLEITETTLMADPELALLTARGIAERGVGLSIDDYGTGYASLAYLHDIPAAELKLDRSFTGRLLTEERTASIVAATVDLAHRLGMRLLAEGVEDEATLASLTALGCDETQGYLHSRPVPAQELTRWLHERRAARTAPDAAAVDRATADRAAADQTAVDRAAR